MSSSRYKDFRNNSNQRGRFDTVEQNDRPLANWRRDHRRGKSTNDINRDGLYQHEGQISRTERTGRKYEFSKNMGFKYVQSLLENQDLEYILFTLSNDRKGFRELLDNVTLSNDLLTLILKLLSKICSSHFAESKIYILQMAFNSEFINHLIKFISIIAIQDQKEKSRSRYFWNDTDEFFNNIINVCRNVHDLIPLTSCDKILKVLKALKIYMPIIAGSHSIPISDEIIKKVDNLHNVVEMTSGTLENKMPQNAIIKKSIELEPPNDFRQISVYPDIKEITSEESPFLRPNVVEGPYQNVNHYLDIQFRLLREDFVAPLRKGICNYLKNSKQRLEDIKIYNRVRFLKEETVNEQNCYRIQYDFSGKRKSFEYENCRRFMYGSLLCFTHDNFRTIIFGKVIQREMKDLMQGQFIIGFNENVIVPKQLFESDYLMVESKVFFEPYYQVLNVLKRIRTEDFPMERYIIKVETKIDVPAYLLNINPVFYQIDDHIFWPLNWSDRKFNGLNDAQQIAFQAALTKEFTLIQGPPGTGKTFLGLKIAHTLIKNKSAWYKKTPMLVICFTNHALDQFLEGVLEVTNDIIRVGGQSKNPNLNEFNIKNHRYISNETVKQLWHEVRTMLQNIASINETLKNIQLNESVIDFSLFSGVIPDYNRSWFLNANRRAILEWLFDSRQYQNPFGSLFREDQVENDIIEEDFEKGLFSEEGEMVDDVFANIICPSFTPLISLRSLSEKIKTLSNDLTILRGNSSLDELKRMFEEEKICCELDILERDFKYLQRRLDEAAKGLFKGQPDYVDLENPHLMPPNMRWKLYYYWLEQFRRKLIENGERASVAFRKKYKLYNEMRDIQDTQIMKNSVVVGMTTTGAARLKSSLQSLMSPIVIVEEAAEVLEAHVVSSLTNSCKHLILIGDHQQLKPSTANFKVETKYLLGISLFERMIKNNLECHTLTIQHRMRPEIADLIRPAIYPILEDHESVLNRVPIRGLESCLYFIDHQEPETLCKDSSKKNIHEASFFIKLAKHLILNGYEPNKITILVTYLGQMFEVIRQRKGCSVVKDVKISVLDNYQGEENDIVLLSLVRNNDESKIGFLKIENRVCVALSRARNCLYIMGNMTQLCASSDIWQEVRQTLNSQNAIGPYLTLRCQVHTHKLTEVKTAEDFLLIPEGGCNLMCETYLSCGHVCKSLCHIKDRDHSLYKCMEKCNKVLCNNEEHVCKKLCYEDCGPCCYPVEQNLNCGHTVIIECNVDPATYDCSVGVKTVLPCGHEANKPCFRDADTFSCPEPCAVRVEPCGHACIRACHIRNDPDHLEYQCRKLCARPRMGCTLLEKEKHACTNFCFETCQPCDVGVKKIRGCSHVFTVACSKNVDDIECKKPCKKILPCGHNCKNSCKDPCGNCNVEVQKKVPSCLHTIKIKCSQEPDRKFCRSKCPRLLPCGHKCVKKCFQDCTTFCTVKVDCAIPSPCGHIVKSITCALKNSGGPKILLKHCTEKCTTKLKCGHICSGICGECSQGRIHQRCNAKCGNTLICNHECPIPCSQACKPCQQKCNYKCPHNKCPRRCGDPCIKCNEKCSRICEHQTCKLRCGDICSIPPCYQPCKKLLKCNHPCVGFCGDPCPVLCLTCNKEELTEIFLGHEDEENARYVMLQDCKHVFESSDIEKWLQSDGEIMAKFCPKCKTPICSTERFSEYIKGTIIDITVVKNKLCGVDRENELRRIEYLNEIDEMLDRTTKLFQGLTLHTALGKLKERLKVSRKTGKNIKQRQSVNKFGLDVIYAKLQIMDTIINVYGKQEKQPMATDDSFVQMSFILAALTRDENDITAQEIDDIMLEARRLSRIVQYEKIKSSSNFSYVRTKEDAIKKIQVIEKILFLPKRYDDESDNILQTALEELNKLASSLLSITMLEKKQIVAALGLNKGHWFKCPNGHYYIITECGGANQISKCNECGEKIGGESHQLLPGQSHAPEMDDSRYPAWSEGANMENYHL